MIGGKVTSVRLLGDQPAELDTVARVEGVSVSEIVRAAIYQYIAARRADPEFKKRLEAQVEEDREVLERLASGGRGGTGTEN
jgi:predicted transcriptional regulator